MKIKPFALIALHPPTAYGDLRGNPLAKTAGPGYSSCMVPGGPARKRGRRTDAGRSRDAHGSHVHARRSRRSWGPRQAGAWGPAPLQVARTPCLDRLASSAIFHAGAPGSAFPSEEFYFAMLLATSPRPFPAGRPCGPLFA